MSKAGDRVKKSYPVSCDDINNLTREDRSTIQSIDTFLQTKSGDTANNAEEVAVYHTMLMQARQALQQRMQKNAMCFSLMIKEINKEKQNQSFFICAQCETVSKKNVHEKS